MDATADTSHRRGQLKLETEAWNVLSVPLESIRADLAQVATLALLGHMRLQLRARLALDVAT